MVKTISPYIPSSSWANTSFLSNSNQSIKHLRILSHSHVIIAAPYGNFLIIIIFFM